MFWKKRWASIWELRYTGTTDNHWADEHNLADVMPSGENRFYVEHKHIGNMYGGFTGRGLVKTREPSAVK